MNIFFAVRSIRIKNKKITLPINHFNYTVFYVYIIDARNRFIIVIRTITSFFFYILMRIRIMKFENQNAEIQTQNNFNYRNFVVSLPYTFIT